MNVELVDCEHVIRQGARGGLPNSYTIAKLQITASNRDEVDRMVAAMMSWANGTFEPVIIVHEDDGTTVVTPRPEPEKEFIDVDPITGRPIS